MDWFQFAKHIVDLLPRPRAMTPDEQKIYFDKASGAFLDGAGGRADSW